MHPVIEHTVYNNERILNKTYIEIDIRAANHSSPLQFKIVWQCIGHLDVTRTTGLCGLFALFFLGHDDCEYTKVASKCLIHLLFKPFLK